MYSREKFGKTEEDLKKVNADITGEKSVDELLDLVSEKEGLERDRENLMGEAHQEAIKEDASRTKERESSAFKVKEKLGRREEIFRDKTLDKEQRLEMMQETDFERAQLILDDPKIYDEYKSQAGGELSESLKKELLEVMNKSHYMLTPGMEVFLARSMKSKNQTSRLEFVARRELKSGTLRFSFLVYEPYVHDSERAEHFEHVGVIDIDIPGQDIRDVVIPEAISIENPRKLLPPSSVTDMESTRESQVESFLEFIKVPEYIPRPTTGETVEPSGKEREIEPIEIKDRVNSTLMCRWRTIDESRLETVGESVENLINSWNDEEKAVLRSEGGGDIRLQLFSSTGKEDDQTVYEELPDKPKAGDLQSIRELIKKEIENGAQSVTMVCLGSWVKREYRNEEPGPTHRPHWRRTTGGIKLILNRDVTDPEIRNLQKKIKEQEELSKDDLGVLRRILVLDDAQIMETVKRGGITFKDGSFNPHPHADIRKQEYYRREDSA